MNIRKVTPEMREARELRKLQYSQAIGLFKLKREHYKNSMAITKKEKHVEREARLEAQDLRTQQDRREQRRLNYLTK